MTSRHATVGFHSVLFASAANFAHRLRESSFGRGGLFGHDAIRHQDLIDLLASPGRGSTVVWIAFVLLVSLIVANNLFWRLANWIANDVFVKVTGDL